MIKRSGRQTAGRKSSGSGRTSGTRRAKAPGQRRLPPPLPDGETQQRILDAARAVFVRRGTAGARMQEIAQEAGVNQALLHYYFRSKELLATAVFRQTAGRILPVLIEMLGSDLPLEEKIRRVVELYLDNLSRNPFLSGYVLSELHHHPERAAQLISGAIGAEPARVVPPAIEKLRRQIAERVGAGEFRPITVEQFVANLVSLCVFPFAARPMLAVILGLDDAAFPAFIAKRKAELPVFFRNALRP